MLKFFLCLVSVFTVHATPYVGLFRPHTLPALRKYALVSSPFRDIVHEGKKLFTFHHSNAKEVESWAKTYSGVVWGVEENKRRTASSTCTLHSANSTFQNLDVIDGTLDGQYTLPFGCNSTGTPVHIFIIDTGAYNHSDFGGRLSSTSFCALNTSACAAHTPSWSDVAGHGTHVSGIAAGAQTGVWPYATLHAVKVLDDTGTGSDDEIIRGAEWAEEQALLYGATPAVASMSLGGGYFALENLVIQFLYNAGIVSAIAAGNSATNACTVSPASAPSAITVAATDSSLNFQTSFSDYGPCVDISAPGLYVTSTWPGGGYQILSGTSMATPHVSGAAAFLLSQKPCLSPSQITQALTVGSGTTNNVPANTTTAFLNITAAYSYAMNNLTCNAQPPPLPAAPPYSTAFGGTLLSNYYTFIQLEPGTTYNISAGCNCTNDPFFALADGTFSPSYPYSSFTVPPFLSFDDNNCGLCPEILFTVPLNGTNTALENFYLINYCNSATCASTISIQATFSSPPPPVRRCRRVRRRHRLHRLRRALRIHRRHRRHRFHHRLHVRRVHRGRRHRTRLRIRLAFATACCNNFTSPAFFVFCQCSRRFFVV